MTNIKAKPFLKWAGGKSQLLQQFENFYPKELKSKKINRYIEPFIGGGAVFFEVVQRFKFEHLYISDINKDLILAYKTIKRASNDLIYCLEEYQANYYEKDLAKRKEFFYEIRNEYNLEKDLINYKNYSKNWVERTAKLIFLNRTCFNGLFRLNSSGQFNVPFGDYKKPRILDEANSNVLQRTEIKNADYQKCFDKITQKTFLYFDPPYRPISKTSSFTTYNGSNFADDEQIKLAEFLKKLTTEKHAKFMLSNSDPKNENLEDNFFDDLYKDFFINRVSATRIINSKAEKRGQINELLLTNYRTKQLSKK